MGTNFHIDLIKKRHSIYRCILHCYANLITLHHVYKSVEINLGMRLADLEEDHVICVRLM